MRGRVRRGRGSGTITDGQYHGIGTPLCRFRLYSNRFIHVRRPFRLPCGQLLLITGKLRLYAEKKSTASERLTQHGERNRVLSRNKKQSKRFVEIVIFILQTNRLPTEKLFLSGHYFIAPIIGLKASVL